MMRVIRSLCLLPAACAALLATGVPSNAAPEGDMLLKTVVIDPGHGGKDPGCISRDKKVQEKMITLDIAKRLAGKISSAYPEVTVLLTRTDDKYIELEDRAMKANNAGADLFISIHVNSVDKGTAANGYSVHCLGQSSRKGNDLFSKNLDLVRRENSVILLEEDYQTRYQGFDPSDPQSTIFFSLMQNANLGNSLQFADDVEQAMGSNPIRHSRGVSQDPFWVLWRTAMPAVLIEVGFITNPDDLATLGHEQGRERIATNLLNAFSAYKARYDATLQGSARQQASASSGSETAAAGSIIYAVQVLATGRQMSADDPYFGGHAVIERHTGKLYKYYLFGHPDLQQTRREWRAQQKKYPDSFLVKIEGGTVTAVR